jgi:nitrate reductase NapE component
MDDNPPQNPKEKKSWLKVFAFLEVGVFEIFFVAIVLAIFFGILNYFNILSLSTLYPKQLGFLPTKVDQESQITSTQRSTNVLPVKLACPSLKEFCQKGQSVIKDGNYIGFGGKLASASAIFAAFDGDLTVAKTDQEKFKILYLDSPNQKARAIYFLRGQIIKKVKVSKGEQIAIANGKTISIYDDNSLIFSVIIGYPNTNTPIILNKENFTL